MKRLISIILFIAAPLFSTGQSNSWSTAFCNAADDQGNLSGFYTSFYVPSSGAYIYVVLYAPEGKTFNTKHISLDIYKNGKFSNSLGYTIQPDWGRFWAKVTFYDAADYRIDTYDVDDDEEDFLGIGTLKSSGSVTIKNK